MISLTKSFICHTLVETMHLLITKKWHSTAEVVAVYELFSLLLV